MKAGWETKPIGELFKVVNGGTPKTGVPAYWDGEHQWITPAEMGGLPSPYVNRTRRTLTDEGLRVGAAIVPADSIILSTRAPIGHLVINQTPMAFNQGCKGLVPSSAINTKFAYYFLLANISLLESLGTGTTFKELSGGKLKEVLFAYPPLPEQRRIVAILDAAFAAIATARAHTEQNLRNARELFESQLAAVFSQRGAGWVETDLEHCCKQISAGGDVPKHSLSQDKTARFAIPIYSNGIKDNGLYGFTEFAQITEPSITISARGTIGFAAIRNEPFYPVVRLIALTPNEKLVDLDFLYYALASMDFTHTGTSIPQLTVPNIKGRTISLPPLAAQKSITRSLSQIREQSQHLQSLAQRKLAALDELKQSLLQQAFSGQL